MTGLYSIIIHLNNALSLPSALSQRNHHLSFRKPLTDNKNNISGPKPYLPLPKPQLENSFTMPTYISYDKLYINNTLIHIYQYFTKPDTYTYYIHDFTTYLHSASSCMARNYIITAFNRPHTLTRLQFVIITDLPCDSNV